MFYASCLQVILFSGQNAANNPHLIMSDIKNTCNCPGNTIKMPEFLNALCMIILIHYHADKAHWAQQKGKVTLRLLWHSKCLLRDRGRKQASEIKRLASA